MYGKMRILAIYIDAVKSVTHENEKELKFIVKGMYCDYIRERKLMNDILRNTKPPLYDVC